MLKEKQDSKELSPRPLENAPKTFNSKNAQRLIKLLMLIMLLNFYKDLKCLVLETYMYNSRHAWVHLFTTWCDLIQFSNMSKHVLMLMMQFDTILKHVQTCHNAYDAIWYDSQTCPDMS